MATRRKTTITLSTVIGEDRRVVIDLPPDTPTGEVDLEVVVKPAAQETDTVQNPAREALRAKLLAAGALTVYHLPEGFTPPTEEEVLEAGRYRPDATPSEVIIREMRDED